VKGIEPSYAAWEAAVLPLNYTRKQEGADSIPASEQMQSIVSRSGVLRKKAALFH
jgi:hypothetical protein